MDVIDFHTHIFPDTLASKAIEKLLPYSPDGGAYTDGTLKGLKNSMTQNGITKSVVLSVATKVSQVTPINQNCIEIRSTEIVPFGALHPQTENVPREISFLKENKIKGVKFHPEYQDFYIDDPKMFPIYEELSAAGLIALFHAGMDPAPFSCDHGLPDAFRRISENFPKLTIIAAHMGGWKLWNQVKDILLGLPIYFDTSAISNHLEQIQFVELARAHGIEKILFGTDSPWYDQGATRKWIETSGLNKNEIELVLSENAKRLLM